MKKLFLLAVIFALALAGCDDDDDAGYYDAGYYDDDGDTPLIVQNQTSYTLYAIKWSGVVISSLRPSESGRIWYGNVTSGYLYFSLPNDLECHTQEIITKGETKVYTITNNTLVVALNDITNTPKRLQEIAANSKAFSVIGNDRGTDDHFQIIRSK